MEFVWETLSGKQMCGVFHRKWKDVWPTDIFDWLFHAGGVEATLLVEVACRQSGQNSTICDVLHLELNQAEGVC